MKLENAAITVLLNYDGMKIELHDKNSMIMFARVELNQEQTCQALGRLSYVPCKAEVFGLDVINKRMEHTYLEFAMPDGAGFHDKGAAEAECMQRCPAGWTPDAYFDSQGSFFDRDGKPWARCIIRRWVDVAAEGGEKA